MRNLTIVVTWHGLSPKVSTSCIYPRWALTYSSFSLPIPILSKADVKIISAELPL